MNKKNKYTFPFLLTLFFLVSMLPTSCIDNADEQEAEFQQLVDTLYLKRIKILNPELDSICEMQMDSLIQYHMDSIKALRLKEIEKLIQKGKNLQTN